jgi:hypothetical protein
VTKDAISIAPSAKRSPRSERRGGFSDVEQWGGRGCPTKSDRMTFLRYLAVGGLNTAFGYFCYAAFVLGGAPIWLAVGSSTVLAILFNFFSYGGLVFGDTSHPLAARPDMGRPGATMGTGAPPARARGGWLCRDAPFCLW